MLGKVPNAPFIFEVPYRSIGEMPVPIWKVKPWQEVSKSCVQIPMSAKVYLSRNSCVKNHFLVVNVRKVNVSCRMSVIISFVQVADEPQVGIKILKETLTLSSFLSLKSHVLLNLVF